MAFGFNKTRYSPIAVDFGADSLKLLQTVPTNPPQLIGAAAAPVPEEARQDSGRRYAFLAEALKNLLASQPFKGRRAMLAIPAFQTLVQHLAIPGGQPAEVEAQIGLHLQQRLNVDPGRMVLRHYPVGPVVRDGSTQQEIICLGALREAVMRYIDLARRCKLDVVGMHGEPLTILRAFGHLYTSEEDQDRSVCYIDMGAATTKVVIAHGTKMVFAKCIHAAGDQVTRHVAAVRQIDFMHARGIRIAEALGVEVAETAAVGAAPMTAATIPSEFDEPIGEAAPDDAVDRGANIDETLDCLIDELQLCIRYYNALFPSRSIEKLIFLGGEAMHKKTCQSIARSVRVAAQLGDPFARLMRIGKAKKTFGVDMDHPQPGWGVPMGLTVSEANL